MSHSPLHAGQVGARVPSGRGATLTGLVRVTLAGAVDGTKVAQQLLAARKAAGAPVSVVGAYLSSEGYGG